MSTPFQELQKLYDKFEFRNKTDISQRIELIGGDSMQVGSRAKVSVPSHLLFNFPSSSWCKVMIPTMEDMIAAGVITDPSTPSFPNKSEKKQEAPVKTSSSS